MRSLAIAPLLFFIVLLLVILGFRANAAEPIKLMVIDTGVALEHPSLTSWKRWFFTDQDITVDHHHGTAMASLALNGEVDATGKGATPVCGEVELIVCNYLPFQKSTRLYECLQNAIDKKVDFVNYSSNGYDFREEEYNYILKMKRNGTLFVTAAGNEGRDVKVNPSFPGMYSATKYLPGALKALVSLTNVLMVGAVDDNGKQWDKSNYGIPMATERGVNVRSAAVGKHTVTKQIVYGTALYTGTSISTALYTNKLLRKKCEVKNAAKNSIVYIRSRSAN